MVVALAIVALAAADQAPSAPLDSAQVDRVRAAPEKRPSKLTSPDATPTFRVHIEERQPLHEIFETPPWQLPHVEWTPPALPAKTAFGTIPMVNVDLLAIAGAMGEVRRARTSRSTADEVRRAIADYCIGQHNAGAGILICDNRIR